jgi:hypothetical protein
MDYPVEGMMRDAERTQNLEAALLLKAGLTSVP